MPNSAVDENTLWGKIRSNLAYILVFVLLIGFNEKDKALQSYLHQEKLRLERENEALRKINQRIIIKRADSVLTVDSPVIYPLLNQPTP